MNRRSNVRVIGKPEAIRQSTQTSAGLGWLGFDLGRLDLGTVCRLRQKRLCFRREEERAAQLQQKLDALTELEKSLSDRQTNR